MNMWLQNSNRIDILISEVCLKIVCIPNIYDRIIYFIIKQKKKKIWSKQNQNVNNLFQLTVNNSSLRKFIRFCTLNYCINMMNKLQNKIKWNKLDSQYFNFYFLIKWFYFK